MPTPSTRLTLSAPRLGEDVRIYKAISHVAPYLTLPSPDRGREAKDYCPQLQMKKLRSRENTGVAQGQTPRRWQSWDRDSVLLALSGSLPRCWLQRPSLGTRVQGRQSPERPWRWGTRQGV